MLAADQAQQAFDSNIGLCDRALIGAAVYSLTRVNAAVGMRG